MKKKVNYDGLDRPYMKTRKQGFGSLYGGNRNSNITNNNVGRSIINKSNEE